MTNPWRRTLAVGTTVEFDGRPYTVSEIDGQWVKLLAADGSALPLMPLRTVALLLPGDESPPVLNERALDVRKYLSPTGEAKLDERLAHVRWIEEGVKPGSKPGDRKDPGWDPEVTPNVSVRMSNIATAIAEERGIQYTSARTFLRRICQKAVTGEAGLADQRQIVPRTTRSHPALMTYVSEFLRYDADDSTRTKLTKYLRFCVWARPLELGDISDSSFYRCASAIYEKHPELRTKSKTRASAVAGGKVSPVRRSPSRVGELWMVDTTTSNVLVWDPKATDKNACTFRPTVVRLLDVASRYVVGRSISDNTNAFATGLAIADAFRSMVDERAAIVWNGRTYPRPFVGLPSVISRWPIPPRRLIGDNGAEVLNAYILLQLERLAIDFEIASVASPRAKAALERHFRTYKDGFEATQRAFTGGSIDERGKAVEQRAILTWDELFQREGEWTDLYNVKEHDGILAKTGRKISPAQLWIELANQQGSVEMVGWVNEWIRFLPSEPFKVTRYGFERKRMVYNAPILEVMLNVPGVAPGGIVRMFWNPSDLRQLYCFDPDGNAYEVPWVLRREETQPISDFTLSRANEHLRGLTYTRRDYQKVLRDLMSRWSDEDDVLVMRRNSKARTEEIQASQLDRLQAFDSGLLTSSATTGLLPDVDDASSEPVSSGDELEDALDQDVWDDGELFERYA